MLIFIKDRTIALSETNRARVWLDGEVERDKLLLFVTLKENARFHIYVLFI